MRSLIRWFIENPVTANLLALMIIGGGLVMFKSRIIVELFPDVSSSTVMVKTVLKGATPNEVETGVTILVEDAIRDVDGIDEVASTSAENVSSVNIDIATDRDPRELLDNIRNKVNAINQFPDNAEKPVIELRTRLRAVGDLAISGDNNQFSERELRDMAERVRSELQDILQNQVQIDTGGFRSPEIAIEIEQEKLIAHNITFDQVTAAINGQSVDLSTGTIKSKQQELILSTKGSIRDVASLQSVVVGRADDGAPLYLRDVVKKISDDYADDSYKIYYQGRPAVTLYVYRVGNGNVIEVMKSVHKYVNTDAKQWLPTGANLTVVDDDSKVVQSRIDLLTNNAIQGGFFVLILLVLFLRPSIAMWVVFGMAVSMCGGLLIMGLMGSTLNMITLFAFIMVLGMVVDDATVIAENVFSHVVRGDSDSYSVLEGTSEVAIPVTFGMLTSVAAFAGIFFVEGRVGQIMGQLPLVVVPVLLFSFFESKFILPTHLRNLQINKVHKSFYGKFLVWQENFSDGFVRLVERFYKPIISWVIAWRYLFIVGAIGAVVLVFATLPLGYLRFIFFPNIERDTIDITVNMDVGTPFAETQKFIKHISDTVEQIKEQRRYPDSDRSPILHMVATVGSAGGDSHVAKIKIELEAPEIRIVPMKVRDLVKELRSKIKAPARLANMAYRSQIGLRGSAITYYLIHDDREIARVAMADLQKFMQKLAFVYDINSDLSLVKEELVMKPKAGMETTGLTLREIVRQVRSYYYGVEVERFFRGRDEVSVIVRLPESSRENLADLNTLQIRSPNGSWLLLRDLVNLTRDSAININRRNQFKSVISISSNYDKDRGNLQTTNQAIEDFIETLQQSYPGLSFQRGGETVEQQKTLSSMPIILLFVLSMLYFLIAVPTKSYVYPVIVILTLPFAISGALLGHKILGQPLTMPSALGMLAMLGVAVNSAIILVVFINREVSLGIDINKAIVEAGSNRFRAVFLTSATTMAGLMPLMLEKSIQAQFLIPVAISIVFGVAASAVATLLVVPVLYRIINDFKEKINK